MKGRFTKSATVHSNDPQNPTTRISISGFAKQYVSVEPSSQVRLYGFYGDKIKKKVTITTIEEQPLKITDITSDIKDKIKYKLKTVKKGKEYSLEIKTSSGLKESFQGKLVLKTNSKKNPELEIFVIGKIQMEVKTSPEYLYFGIIDTKKKVTDPKSLKRIVRVHKAKGDGLSIKKIEASKDWIMTEIETKEKGKKYSIVIKLDKDKLPKGKFREKIMIYTKYGDKSEIATTIIEGKVI